MNKGNLRKILCTLWVLTGVVGLILGVIMVSQAHAAGACASHGVIVKALADKYQESAKALGIAGQVNLVEIFSSKAGTWTILVTTPDGSACIIAAGTEWVNLPPVKTKEDDT